MTAAASCPPSPNGLTGKGHAIVFLLVLLLLACPRSTPAEDLPSNAPIELGEAPLLSAGPLKYQPARGLRLGSTGGVIGGFTNLKAESTEHSGGEFALDNLNFFVIFDPVPHFRAVAELQLKDIFVADEKRSGTQSFGFDVRRLFGDVTVSDELQLRAGTFLTPVGYWNLILAPPLTWTTEAPLIVEKNFFQPTTTGFMLHGSTGVSSSQLGYSFFSQFLKPLEHNPDLDPPDHTAGVRLAYETGPAWSVSATYQAAQNDALWSHLGGVGLLWQPSRGEVMSELYVQDGSKLSSMQWGTYLQGVLDVRGPFYAVGRYEHFDPPSPGQTLNLLTVGGVWKPFPFMAVKVEYRVADHALEDRSLNGFFSSWSTLF